MRGAMFERFTDRARRVVVLAQEEARALNHNYIGTEHILLGLVHDGEGVAAKALESLGVSLGAVRRQVEEIIGHGAGAATGHIPFTPRAKKVLELSLREARQLGYDYIGTEHILLGLIREGEGVAAQVLQKLGASLPQVRQAVIQLLSNGPRREGEEFPPAQPDPRHEVGRALERAGRLRRVVERLVAAADDPSITPELLLPGLLLRDSELIALEGLARRLEQSRDQPTDGSENSPETPGAGEPEGP
jgi:ATP-dependent Clp protease ATP-binding subunit ClpC